MITNFINRIVFILDESGSMYNLKDEVIKVFGSQIEHLADVSKQMDQETRVSVYTFNDNVQNLIWDKDVLRLPSLKGYYNPDGCTALIDATLKVINDYEKSVPLYGDVSTLLFVLSDGENNRNAQLAPKLKKVIADLPDDWTIVFLAPNALGIAEAKRYGFPASNIQVWSVDKKGLNEVGENIKKATTQFMVARSQGIKGTKSLFALDASNLNTKVVQTKLEELRTNEFELFPVTRESDIKSFVESWTKKPYVKGSAYYQLTKPESIQAYKQICVQNKKNGKVYTGVQARKLLSLPDYEVKVNPDTHDQFDLFVQSTSTNRKLVKGTKLIVLN